MNSFHKESKDNNGWLKSSHISVHLNLSTESPKSMNLKSVSQTPGPSILSTETQLFKMSRPFEGASVSESIQGNILSNPVDDRDEELPVRQTVPSDQLTGIEQEEEEGRGKSTSELFSEKAEVAISARKQSQALIDEVIGREEEHAKEEDDGSFTTTTLKPEQDEEIRPSSHQLDSSSSSSPSSLVSTAIQDEEERSSGGDDDLESAIRSRLQNVKEEDVTSENENENENEGDENENDENDENDENSLASPSSTSMEIEITTTTTTTPSSLEGEENDLITSSPSSDGGSVSTNANTSNGSRMGETKKRRRNLRRNLKKKSKGKGSRKVHLAAKTRTLLNYTFVEGYHEQTPYDLVLVTSVEMKGVGIGVN